MMIVAGLWLIASVAFSLGTALLSYFILSLVLTILWRAYKTVLVRKIDFLRRRNLKPIESRQAVLITGASSGIGLAVAKHLYKVGYSVIATYFDKRDPGYEELVKLQSAGNAGPKRLLLHQLDVMNQKQVEQLYETIERQLAENRLELYALINNAGLGSLQPFAWFQRKTMLKLIDTNISGALLMTREFLPLLAKRGKTGSAGRLLFVSSGLGFVPGATYATYGVTKCAHLYFSRCMNLELKERYGVQSVSMVPHNFIKNTNICAQNVQNNQLAWDELKPIERELYAKQHKEQLDLVISLERASKEHVKAARAHDKVSIDSSKNPGSGRNTTSNTVHQAFKSIVNYLHSLKACLEGTNLSATLEESGALECFEDALRLRDPPEEIFAGDLNFQLIVGSLLLTLPHSLIGLLSASVAPSLYK